MRWNRKIIGISTSIESKDLTRTFFFGAKTVEVEEKKLV